MENKANEAYINSFKRLLSAFSLFFKHNWVILLLSFICAVIMWGLILKNENPERIKTVSGVKVSLEGEADLLARQFVVVGDRSEVFPELTARVSTDLLRYSELSAKDITAKVSVSQISASGEYELNINATSSKGSIVSISPNKMTLTVDKLNSRKVPVEINTVGTMPNDLEQGELSTSLNQIEISGAASIITKVEKAGYTLDLSQAATDINQSVTLTLMDSSGSEVPRAEIYGELPSVTVTMPVYSYKEVPFDLKKENCTNGKVNTNYTIEKIYADSEKVRILSDDPQKLENIKSIPIERINVAGATETIEKEVKYVLPEGVWIKGKPQHVHITVSIQEKQATKELVVPIKIEGAKNGKHYNNPTQTVKVTLRCGIILSQQITVDDVIVYVNVANLENGTHEKVKLQYRFSDNIPAGEVAILLSLDTVSITVS